MTRKTCGSMEIIFFFYFTVLASGHIQYNFINSKKHHRIVLFPLKHHTSHVLKPLYVTIFNQYMFSKELQCSSIIIDRLDVFIVAYFIPNAYKKTFF